MAVTHKSLLQFEAGLLVTAVALVAAGFAAVKDAWTVAAWRLPLLSFIAWMAVTILAATIAAFVLQLRKTDPNGDPKKAATGTDAIVAFVPVLPGLAAALQLIRLAWSTAGAPLFW